MCLDLFLCRRAGTILSTTGCPATQMEAGEGVPRAGCRDGPRLQGLHGGFRRPELLLLFHTPLPMCLSAGWDGGACTRGKPRRMLCRCLHGVKIPNNILSDGFPASEFFPACFLTFHLPCLALSSLSLCTKQHLGHPKYLQYLPARDKVFPGHRGSLTTFMPHSCHAHTW